jgi:phospholipid/cholesterol/gamma-HCH transport system substrate-binding protein
VRIRKARVAVGVAIALLLTAGIWVITRNDEHRVSALFDNGVGIYEGTEVRVLGVGVGTVAEVHPEGKQVRVELEIDPDVAIPAGAQALAVSPSLVGDRYIQLTPPYRGGPTMQSGTTIPREDTATPLELDQLLASVNELTTALGPDGANSTGSLSRLVDAGADTLAGNGKAINETLERIGQLSSTLASHRGDVFASVRNLRTFVSTLVESDAQVRKLTGRLADVVGFLGDEKEDLGSALRGLATALGDVKGFVRDNRGLIKSNVNKLAKATRALVDQRGALAEILDVAPTALSNLNNSYDSPSGTFQARPNFNELSEPPLLTVCGLIRQHRPREVPATLAEACEQVADIVGDKVRLPSAAELIADAQQGKLPPLPLVGAPGGPR